MSDIETLQDVPAINFVDTNVDNLLNAYINTYQLAYKETTGEDKILYPTDKERIWLYTAALFMYQALISMDLSAKQNFLKYAKGAYLDNIGATRHSLTRAASKYAKVLMEFTLSQALTTNKTIPSGTRVTAGDNIFFISTVDYIIPAGQTVGLFVFECTEAGEIGNGYALGQINTLVDPIPFVQSVENTEVSQGGADIQSDDSFTQEIWEAPEGYAVAGPEEAYIYRAKSFSQAIEDVVAYSPDDSWDFEYTFNGTTESPTINNDGTITIADTNISEYALDLSIGRIDITFIEPVTNFSGVFPRGGVVNIVPLLQNAEIPEQTFLEELREFLSADKYRPLTDKVQALAPTQKEYSINLKYWIDSKDKTKEAQIQADVAAAVLDYKTWQDSKLSRDINPDELIARVKNAGAKRLEITGPTFLKLKNTEIAKCTIQTLNYQGLED